jgi:hypothetical protein
MSCRNRRRGEAETRRAASAGASPTAAAGRGDGAAPAIPAYAHERRAICRACPDYEAALTRESFGCGLARHAHHCYLRRPLACCPANPPRWGPVLFARPGAEVNKNLR